MCDQKKFEKKIMDWGRGEKNPPAKKNTPQCVVPYSFTAYTDMYCNFMMLSY